MYGRLSWSSPLCTPSNFSLLEKQTHMHGCTVARLHAEPHTPSDLEMMLPFHRATVPDAGNITPKCFTQTSHNHSLPHNPVRAP